MPREVDEDLIEATIRKVAEAQASRSSSEKDDAPVSLIFPSSAVPGEGEDAIDDAGPSDEGGADADPHDAPATESLDHEDDVPPPKRAVDPEAINATLRRLQSERKLEPADDEAAVASGPAFETDDDVDEFQPTAIGASGDLTPEQRFESLLARLEAVLPMLERFARISGGQPGDAATGLRAVRGNGGYRAGDARASTAEQLEPDVIDKRPLPKPLPPLQVEPKRGLDLLPKTYRITVEDKRRGVDLVPLHRALLSMDGVRDMSLLSYNNGVAIVALDMTTQIDPDALARSVGRAMSREARAEVHNEHTLVVKLAED